MSDLEFQLNYCNIADTCQAPNCPDNKNTPFTLIQVDRSKGLQRSLRICLDCAKIFDSQMGSNFTEDFITLRKEAYN